MLDMLNLSKNLVLLGKSTQNDFKFEFTKDKYVVITQQPSQILHIHIDYMK
jgi:hypothetical protein